MNRDMERQQSLMDRTGLGLLPGVALALGVVLVAALALTVSAWWVTVAVFVAVLGALAAVTVVVIKLIDVDGGSKTR